MSSEFERLDWLREWVGQQGPQPAEIVLGIGDDAAAWCPPAGESVVLSVDVQVEGVHFRREWLSPGELGRRAIDVSASDLAAMAARPGGVLLALSLDDASPEEDFRELFRGLAERARELGLAVLGGNLSQGPLTVSVTAVGSAPVEGLLRRDSARAGDAIYVTGRPGRAGLGRTLLERGAGPRGPVEDEAILRFRSPQARLKEALALRDEFRPHAMIDLSDGLAADLGHILAASRNRTGKPLGALLNRPALRELLDSPGPSGPERGSADSFSALATRLGLDPLAAVLEGGEDYELLFTADPREPGARGPELAVTRIGEITADENGALTLCGDGAAPARWKVRGFDHFGADRGGAGAR